MKTKLFLLIYNLLQRVQKYIADHDEGYRRYRNWHMRPMSYADYLKAFQEWKALEKKYGDWCAAYEAEPRKCADLELLLA